MARQITEERNYEAREIVPFMDLKTEHQRLRNDLTKTWHALLDSAAFVGGRQVEEFEAKFAQYCEVEHTIGVANGTDSLLLALRALGIGRNDEVITASNS